MSTEVVNKQVGFSSVLFVCFGFLLLVDWPLKKMNLGGGGWFTVVSAVPVEARREDQIPLNLE